MTIAAVTFRASGLLAVMCVVLSAATIWLVVSDPVAVATAVNDGDVSSMLSLLTRVLTDTFRSILRYL